MQLTYPQYLWWLLVLIPLFLWYRFSLVDRPLKWMRMSIALRALAVLLLVLALCRPAYRKDSDALHVVFLLDVSQSVDLEAAQSSLAQVQAALQALPSGDTSSFFLLANGVRPTTVEAAGKTLERWQQGIADDEFRSASRLAEGVLATRLAFPAGRARRLVLLSDGLQTHGDLTAALNTLRQENVEVRWFPLHGVTAPEAAVVALEPNTPQAFSGEMVRMKVSLAANQAIKGRVRLLHQGVAMMEKPVNLVSDPTAPSNTVTFDIDMRSPGASVWTAELLPEQDHFPLNNQATAVVQVRGKSRVLAIHQTPKELRPISRALAEQEIEMEVRGKNGLPDSLEGMLEFEAIILADLAATDIPTRQMELLKRYVQNFGGGLAMFGSENSFGLGGYYKTPVEDVLPLVSRFEKEKEKPSLAMALVIDKSGSMDGAPIAMCRQAAKAAVELLGAQDQICVVGFDSNPQIICEMRRASDKEGINSAVDTLQASGGTDVYVGMVAGKELLDNTTAKIKHMIVLTDGQTPDQDFPGLTQTLRDNGVTVSTVAMGDGASKDLLIKIAEIGAGRFYEASDPSNVPQIFTRETMQATKSAIKEDLYGSVITGDHPMLAGYAQADLPSVLGYVMTEPKPATQVLIAAETGDPLLAVGRFGLGQGLCWTADLSEKWGGEWLAWDGCGKFWAQVLRAIIRKNDAEGLEVRSRLQGETMQLDITRHDPNGTPVANIKWDGQAIDENGKAQTFHITPTGLGRYQASIALAGRESLTLRLQDTDSDKLKILHYHRPSPPEYRLTTAVPAALTALPAFTAPTLRDQLQPVPSRQPLDNACYLCSLICALGSVVFRRV